MIFGKKKKEREEKNALASQLLSDSRQKKFDDWKNWPDAYVVDQVAVYAAGGRTLLYVDERVEDFDIPEGVENIYHRCFACCDKLKQNNMPSTVKRIGKKAFSSCVSLKEINIPQSVSIIDEGIFMNCSSLEHIDLPAHLTEITARTLLWMASHNPKPYRSLGNGSAMRCSSAGWLAKTEEECIRMAHETAAPTHNHPEGFKGAEATALAIFHLKNGKDKAFVREQILDRYYPDWSNKKYADFHEIYQTTQENVSMHISNIYEDKKLEKEGTYKKFLLFFATVQNKTMVSTNRLQLCRA